MSVKIKNYTSGVPAEKSISLIERELMEIGATGISKEILDNSVASISFSVSISGQRLEYRLPARISSVYDLLMKNVKRAKGSGSGKRRSTADTIKDQAERTAWKIILDWILAQGALIRLGQSNATEVFLPYMLIGNGKNKTTLWTHMNTRGMSNFLLEGPK